VGVPHRRARAGPARRRPARVPRRRRARSPGAVADAASQAGRVGGISSVQPFHVTERPYEQLSLFPGIVSLLGTGAGRRSDHPPACSVRCSPTSRAYRSRRRPRSRCGARSPRTWRSGIRYRDAHRPVTDPPRWGPGAVPHVPAGPRQLDRGMDQEHGRGRRSGAAAPVARRVPVDHRCWERGDEPLVRARQRRRSTPSWARASTRLRRADRRAIGRATGTFGWLTAALYPIPLVAFMALFAAPPGASGSAAACTGGIARSPSADPPGRVIISLPDGAAVAFSIAVVGGHLHGHRPGGPSPGFRRALGHRPVHPDPTAGSETVGWWIRHVRVLRWKDRLPEAGAFFAGGRGKRRLGSRLREDLVSFRRETIRAERVHWLIMATGPLHLLWCRQRSGAGMVAFGVLFDAPFIVVQRVNRGRLERDPRPPAAEPGESGEAGGELLGPLDQQRRVEATGDLGQLRTSGRSSAAPRRRRWWARRCGSWR
jgi:hypothetical protein